MINSFQDEFRFLSNFEYANVKYDGVIYPTVENAFVAAKTLDLADRQHISTLTPGQAKRYGRSEMFVLRDGWNDIRVGIMYDLVMQKFIQEPLRTKLLITDDIDIVEGNTWGDVFWGQSPIGTGANTLGKILMSTREHLKSLI